MFTCECGKSFDKLRGMTGHQANCKIHQKLLHDQREARRLPNGMFKCENPECGKEHDGSYGSGRFCSKHCRLSYSGKKSAESPLKNERMRKLHEAAKKQAYGNWKCIWCEQIFRTRAELSKHRMNEHFGSKKQISSWRKGLTKDNCESIKHQVETLKARIASGQVIPSFKGKHHTEETKKKLALKGGKRFHSGRGKQGRYHGIWCDSSWELAWIIYQEDHQVKFKKYHGYFEYEFEGAKHKYYPDFVLEDGTIVEIKGYWSKQWQAKLDQLPKDKNFLILGKNEMTPILEYVKTKYGDNFVQMYE